MKHKGVALLITLFFISAISLIILKNLDDSNSFMDEVEFDTALTQLKITNANVQDEVIPLMKKYYVDNDTIDEILKITSDGIPFDYGNITLFLSVDEFHYPSCGLKGINTMKKLAEACEDSIVDKISYPYEFIDIIKKYDMVNQEQVDWVIDKYLIETKDPNFKKIKNKFGYLSSEDQNGTFFKCKYNIKVNGLNAECSFIFNVEKDNSKAIEEFKLSFK